MVFRDIFFWKEFEDKLKLTQGGYTPHFRKQFFCSVPAGRSRLFRLRRKRPQHRTVAVLQWHPLRLLRIPRGCRRNSRKSLIRPLQSMLSKKRKKSWRRCGSIEICGSKIDLKCLQTRWDTFGIFWILAVPKAPRIVLDNDPDFVSACAGRCSHLLQRRASQLPPSKIPHPLRPRYHRFPSLMGSLPPSNTCQINPLPLKNASLKTDCRWGHARIPCLP